MWRLVGGIAIASAALLLWGAPDADADPVGGVPMPAPPGPAQLPTQGGGGLGGGGGIGPGGGLPGILSGPDISPGVLGGLFLCPGFGAAASVLGGGGGFCDYSITAEGHIHCEWGGFNPIANGWSCWRVFPGRPDHPMLPDPDIIPDGYETAFALNGPTPQDQWPPPGLAPAGQLPPPEGPPPGPPP